MTIFQYSLLFFSVVAGGLIYFLIGKTNRSLIKLMLAFSGSYLFAISILHLLPGIYSAAEENIGLIVLAGFFLQLIIDFFSGGIEHGHVHLHEHKHHKIPIAVMFGLCLHSFLEGMPLSDSGTNREELLSGIILHHIPVALALMGMLAALELKTSLTLTFLLVFAGMAPLGAATSEIFIGNNLEKYSSTLMALVVGIFLHISTTILFEYSENHRFNLYKLAVIIAGALFATIHF